MMGKINLNLLINAFLLGGIFNCTNFTNLLHIVMGCDMINTVSSVVNFCALRRCTFYFERR